MHLFIFCALVFSHFSLGAMISFVFCVAMLTAYNHILREKYYFHWRFRIDSAKKRANDCRFFLVNTDFFFQPFRLHWTVQNFSHTELSQTEDNNGSTRRERQWKRNEKKRNMQTHNRQNRKFVYAVLFSIYAMTESHFYFKKVCVWKKRRK